MVKKIWTIFFLAILAYYVAVAQKNMTVSPATFKQIIGCWQGTLNYSGTIIRKPFITTAHLNIKQLGNTNQFEFVHVYTNDANETVTDTLTLSPDGKTLNGAAIVSKQCTPGGGFKIITQVPGFDHDNNKAAIIRHTYIVEKQQYIYKTAVQLEGQTDWLQRQEFIYTRITCSSKS